MAYARTAEEHPVPQDIEIRMLGGLHVSVDGAEVRADAWTTRRARELVLLLALSRQHRLTRDEVVDTLWPQLDSDAGGANLRKAAHFARQVLGHPEAVTLREGSAALLPGGRLTTDVDRFETAADAALGHSSPAECRLAATLYPGDLLPGAPYEPWLEAPRVRLRGKFLRLLRAAGRMEQLAHEEPTDEQAHQALMRAALETGHRTDAIHWYGRLRSALARDLGVGPSTETEALYARCVAGLTACEPAFVGRDAELARARTELSRGSAPAGLVIRGGAGLGKTAFCERLARLAADDGWAVTFVAPRDASRPYGVVAAVAEQLLVAEPALQDRLGPHARAVLAAITPLALRAAPLPGPLARHQVVGALHALLVATRPGAPVLFVVDDADALDDASADVVLHLIATGAPVRTVLSLRSTQSQPTLERGILRHRRTGGVTVLDLEPLGAEEMAAVVARALPRGPGERELRAIVQAAEGNPFVALELARAAGARPEAGIPASAREAITQRLCAVDDDTLAGLCRLALAPETFDAAIAGALMDWDEAGTFPILDRALASEVLVVSGGRYRFRHALVRQALAEQLPPHKLLVVHRRAAERLESLAAALPPALVAHHWMAGGTPERAAPWLLRSAREAFRVAAFTDALRSLAPLLAHAPDHAAALGLRAECLDALGDPLTLSAYDAAAAAAAGSDAAHDLRAKRALAQIKMSDPKGAIDSLVGVTPTSTDARLAEALTYCGAAALGFGDPAIGTAKAAECRRLALRSGDTGALVVASWAQAAAAHARGDLHGSVWADLWDTHHVPHLAVRVFDGHLCITQRFLYGARPYAEVIAFADALSTEASRLGAARGRAFAVTLRGEAKLLSGQLDAAQEDLLLGARLHRAIGGATGEALSLQRLSELALHRGQLAEARSLLGAALDLARHCDIGFHLFDRIYGTRIALATEPDAALAELYEAQEAVRGPLETCPGCRITFAVPAAIAAARAGDLALATDYAGKVEWLAQVVMRLPAWDAALEEVRGQLAVAMGDETRAARSFGLAADVFQRAGQPLDAHRCLALSRTPGRST